MRRRKKTQLDRDAAAAREAGLTYGQWRAQQWEAAGRPEIRGAVVSGDAWMLMTRKGNDI